MRPYGEQTGQLGHRLATREAGKKPARYRRVSRKAEEAAERRKPRKAERCRAKREINDALTRD